MQPFGASIASEWSTMTYALRVVPALLVMSFMGFGQSAVTPVFEVASIRQSAPLPSDFVGHFAQLSAAGAKISGMRASFIRVSLADLIARAYRVRPFQVSGPNWMSVTYFDILAKMPEGASTESVPEMLQSLLADRFKLRLRRTTKEFQLYALPTGNDGLKIPPKPADYVSGRKNGALPRSMEMCARLMSDAMGRPVVNETEQEGEYMFPPELMYTLMNRAVWQRLGAKPEIEGVMSVPSEAQVLRSAQSLGLRLEPRKATLALLLIDQVEKTPTDN